MSGWHIPTDTLIDMAVMRRQGASDAEIGRRYGLSAEVVGKRLKGIAPRLPPLTARQRLEFRELTELRGYSPKAAYAAARLVGERIEGWRRKA